MNPRLGDIQPALILNGGENGIKTGPYFHPSDLAELFAAKKLRPDRMRKVTGAKLIVRRGGPLLITLGFEIRERRVMSLFRVSGRSDSLPRRDSLTKHCAMRFSIQFNRIRIEDVIHRCFDEVTPTNNISHYCWILAWAAS